MSKRRPINQSPAGKPWSPSRLPKLRDQTSRVLARPDSRLRAAYRDDPTIDGAVDRTAHHLTDSTLYWVTPQMSALAVSSAETLTEARWGPADRPAVFGLLVWDEGISTVTYQGADLPVTAASWAPDPAGTAVWLYVSRGELMRGARARGLTFTDLDQIPPLIPASHTVLAATDWTPAEEHGDWRTALTTLWATWALMQQPTISSNNPGRIDHDIERAYQRASRPEPEVTLIDLRRAYVPTAPREVDGPGRKFQHRWVVNGHWRNQAYGPERSLRRKLWVAAYVKGPDGKPMLSTARVNVWRR
jgi:hypothetical protein